MSLEEILRPISSVVILPSNLDNELVIKTFFNISGVIPLVYELIKKNKGLSLKISIEHSINLFKLSSNLHNSLEGPLP